MPTIWRGFIVLADLKGPTWQEDEQLAFELEASQAYLRSVEDRYWDRGWRAEHRGSGIYPESHLWDAVHGYLDLHDAIRARPGSSGAS